jgi:hypothetical protein
MAGEALDHFLGTKMDALVQGQHVVEKIEEINRCPGPPLSPV